MMKRWIVGAAGLAIAAISCGATAVEVNPDWGLAVLGICGVVVAGILKLVPGKASDGMSELFKDIRRIYDKIEGLAEKVVSKEMCNDRHGHYSQKAEDLTKQLEAVETELASLKDTIIATLAKDTIATLAKDRG